MCGRFTLRSRPQAVAEAFELLELPDLSPRYNIAPTQSVATVHFDLERHQRVLRWQRWGLVPRWAKSLAVGAGMINARAEGIATKPAFRQAFTARRCLVVADGFYEWQKTPEGKQPYFLHREDDSPLAFAGLWEQWGPDHLESCTIITTSANRLMSGLHERMPVILKPEDYTRWLDPALRDRKVLESLLQPAAEDLLRIDAVTTLVNNPRNEQPECVVPLA